MCHMEKQNEEIIFPLPTHYKWDDTSESIFKSKCNLPEIKSQITNIKETLNDTSCPNLALENCLNFIIGITNDCLKKKSKRKKPKNEKNKSWYDRELKDLRQVLRSESRKIKKVNCAGVNPEPPPGL